MRIDDSQVCLHSLAKKTQISEVSVGDTKSSHVNLVFPQLGVHTPAFQKSPSFFSHMIQTFRF